MIKPNGYDETQALTGNFEQLPAGAYICSIVEAKEETAQSGAKMLVLHLDILQGDYKDFFRSKYQTALAAAMQTAKWNAGGIYRQLTEGKSVGFFKGLLQNIETSNPPYKFGWGEGSEKTLIGKKICGVFGNEQYKSQNGELKWSTKCKYLTDISMLNNVKVPEDKYMDGASPTQNNAAKPSSAAKMEELNTDDDLPF